MNIIKFHENYPDEASCIRIQGTKRSTRSYMSKMWWKRALLAAKQVALQMQILSYTSEFTNRNSNGAFKTAVSVLVYSNAFADKHFCGKLKTQQVAKKG